MVVVALSNPTGGAALGNPAEATLTIAGAFEGIPTLSELSAIALIAALALLALRSFRLT
jgi:hypothetical protein